MSFQLKHNRRQDWGYYIPSFKSLPKLNCQIRRKLIHCRTLLYLLQQVNRTHVPPSKEISNFNIYYFSLDTWYVMKRGSNRDGCGRTPGSACRTLLYLLQQVNRTHLPPSTGIRIATDKSMNIDQQAAVSTIICPALHIILFGMFCSI